MARTWIPLFFAATLISPWPVLAVHYRDSGSPERIAIPALRASFDSPVSTVFSRARYFLILDLATDEASWVANPYRKAAHAAGLRCAFMLLEAEVGVVVARHIGPEPFSNLSARGVRVFTGDPHTVADAVHQYRSGSLTVVDHPSVPIHYGRKGPGQAPGSGACPMAGAKTVPP